MSATTTRSCTVCGHILASDAKFCERCGTRALGFDADAPSAVAREPDGSTDLLASLLQRETHGEYDIQRELGRGGMAAVYLALDVALNRHVAIKTMLPELKSRTDMVQRFKREAQTAAALDHPHIVQLYAVKETPRLVYIVMKYIEGQSLESVLAARGKLDVDFTRAILAQVGDALAFANRRGVIHRDVKPGNIMLGRDGSATVTDFGIAKVQEAQNLTATGTSIGTPHYMSPEQFENRAVTDASDQYSLGVVAFEMLTGIKPFDADTYSGIMMHHLLDTAPDVRAACAAAPASVAAAIARMLARSPRDRFPSIDDALAALGAPPPATSELPRTQVMRSTNGGSGSAVHRSGPGGPAHGGRERGLQHHDADPGHQHRIESAKAFEVAWLIMTLVTGTRYPEAMRQQAEVYLHDLGISMGRPIEEYLQLAADGISIMNLMHDIGYRLSITRPHLGPYFEAGGTLMLDATRNDGRGITGIIGALHIPEDIARPRQSTTEWANDIHHYFAGIILTSTA